MQEGLKLVRIEFGRDGDILIKFFSKRSKADTYIESNSNVYMLHCGIKWWDG